MVVLLFWYTRFALKIVNGLLHGPWLGCNHFKGNKFTSSSHMVAKMLVSISLFMLHWFTDLHHLNPDSQLSHEQALLLPFALYEPFWNIITYLKPIFLDFVCCWKAAVLAMSFRMVANGGKFFFFSKQCMYRNPHSCEMIMDIHFFLLFSFCFCFFAYGHSFCIFITNLPHVQKVF